MDKNTREWKLRNPPVSGFDENGNPVQCPITLRDQFAIKAMAAMIARGGLARGGLYEMVADRAWEIADVMIEKRSDPNFPPNTP